MDNLLYLLPFSVSWTNGDVGYASIGQQHNDKMYKNCKVVSINEGPVYVSLYAQNKASRIFPTRKHVCKVAFKLVQ